MSSHKAPQGYQPTGQGAADAGYQNANSALAQAGQNLSSSVIPQFGGVTSAMQNNPYYTQAQTGADAAAGMGMNFVAPNQFAASGAEQSTGDRAGVAASNALATGQARYGQLNSQGDAAMGRANSLYDTTMSQIPTYTQGHTAAPGIMMDALSKAGISWDQAQQAIGALVPGNLGAAGSILNTAFDPQQQLYDRSYQQMIEHQNATNSQNGVSGSPFAAGLVGDATRNFDTDWQNSQLNRQIAGLGAYDSAMTTDASNFSNLLGAGTGAYTADVGAGVSSFNNLMSGDVNNRTALTGAAAGGYGTMAGVGTNLYGLGQNALNSGYAGFNSLSGTQANAYANASDLGAAGLNTMSTASQLPNDIYVQNQAQILQALQAQIQGTNASMGLTQDAMNGYGSYMKIGQGATQLAQSAAQINNAASAAQWQGIGQLAGLAMAPFTGGMSLMAAGAMGGGGSSIAANPPVSI